MAPVCACAAVGYCMISTGNTHPFTAVVMKTK